MSCNPQDGYRLLICSSCFSGSGNWQICNCSVKTPSFFSSDLFPTDSQEYLVALPFSGASTLKKYGQQGE